MKIAGGMFGFEGELKDRQLARPAFLSDSSLLFLSWRCATQYLVEKLNPSQVWMPSYLCGSMLDAIDPKTTQIQFFPIGYDLEIEDSGWLDQILPGSLVILIDYFGFPCDRQLVAEIQSRGALVLEDASQALLSTHVGHTSDFTIFSPRKAIGVPDGGILRYDREKYNFATTKLLPPPQEWWLKALESCLGRREFDKFGGERGWYELFQQVEATFPTGPYRMSELSEFLLEKAFDYEAIARARRENYSYLANQFPDCALFKEIDDKTVPLGFPIRVQNRDKVRQFLFDHQVYPPIHWQIDQCTPAGFAASHELSRQIMTIPCDQRLDSNDIIHIAEVLHDALRSSST